MKNIVKAIQSHPDSAEILSKMIMGISPKDIYEYLALKYSAISEKKFVISEKSLKAFQDNYLDIYEMVQADLAETKAALAKGNTEDIELSIKNSPKYKDILIETASKELDIRETIKRLTAAIELRLSQVFDYIQENPGDMNTRVDRVLIEYIDTLGNILEKYHKFTEMPAVTTLNHNITLQVVDQHIMVFHDIIKDILAQMDVDSSLYFMELFNQKMSKLKMPEQHVMTQEAKLAEAKLLSEKITSKLEE